MTRVNLAVTISIDGAGAADVADDLRIDADAGSLDLALLQLIRRHLYLGGDTRDCRIVSAVVNVEGGHNATTDSGK